MKKEVLDPILYFSKECRVYKKNPECLGLFRARKNTAKRQKYCLSCKMKKSGDYINKYQIRRRAEEALKKVSKNNVKTKSKNKK